MATVSISEARNQFTKLVDRVAEGKERIVLTRRDRELVAVVPAEDLHLLGRLVERFEDAEDLRAAWESLAEVERDGAAPLASLKAEFGIAGR